MRRKQFSKVNKILQVINLKKKKRMDIQSESFYVVVVIIILLVWLYKIEKYIYPK